MTNTKPSPTQQRKSLEMANQFVKFGIRFIPMPAFNDEDQEQLIKQAEERVQKLIDANEYP